MSLARFAEGFGEGVNTGIRLGDALVQGRTNAGVREANEVLAEMQNMAPSPFEKAAIPTGDGTTAQPATGYDGEAWNSMKTRYTQAMKRVSDPKVLDQMMDQMAELEKSKVMEYGRMALQSIKAGDMESAQNYMAGVSYYTDPGVTPQFKVAEDGTTLIANPEGPPMVLKPDQLEDFLHQFVNFEGYRELAFDKEKHKDTMDYRERVRLDAVANDAARLALETRNVDSQIAGREATSEVDAARLAKLQQEMEHADLALEAGATKAQMERHKEITDGAADFLERYLEDPGDFKSGGGEDDLLLPGGETTLSPEGQAIVDQSENAKQVLDAGSALETADARNRQAVIRQTLADPQVQMDFSGLVSGIAAGNNPDLTGDQVGAVALSAIMSDGSRYEPFFDRENGLLVVRSVDGQSDYYRIGPSHQALAARMFDPLPQEQAPEGPPPGPNDQAIPAPAQAAPPPDTAIPPG